MRIIIFAVYSMLVLGTGTATAAADPNAAQGLDEPVSQQQFDQIVRDAHLFDDVDANDDGVIDREECRETELACDWDELAHAHEKKLSASEFYERSYKAYSNAARALRARPAP